MLKRSLLLIAALLFFALACRLSLPQSLADLTGQATTQTTPTFTSSPLPTKEIIPTWTSEAKGSTATESPEEADGCNDEACLNACLLRINDQLSTGRLDPLTTYAGMDANLNLIYYSVKAGQLSEPTVLYVPKDYRKYQEDLEAPQRIWNYFTAIMPSSEMKWIDSYTLFTDGPYNTLAWVSPEDSGRDKWTLAVDIVDSQDPTMLTYTLVHEFGHLITLNTDQIPVIEFGEGWTQNSAVCAQFSYSDGCAATDSYIFSFYKKFWRFIYDDWMKTVAPDDYRDETPFEDRVQKFYKKHADQFIEEYAATNITEDMAVSFEYFVLNQKPQDDSIPSKKIQFFYDYPEIVKMRKEIINGMCSYVK